jgi:hypothetical protein
MAYCQNIKINGEKYLGIIQTLSKCWIHITKTKISCFSKTETLIFVAVTCFCKPGYYFVSSGYSEISVMNI